MIIRRNHETSLSGDTKCQPSSWLGYNQACDQVAMFSQVPPEVLAVMGGSDPAVMRRTLEKIDARFGGPVALAKARYGLTDEKIARLRQLYLV